MRSILRLLVSTLAVACCAGKPQGGLAPAVEECRDNPVDGARCVTVRVPEDHARPDGRQLRLRVVVLPATGPSASDDPIVFLAGGPGGAATGFARWHVRHPLRRTRDLVFADQRGTGGSSDLRCQFYSTPPAGRFDDFIPVAKVPACRERLERSADLTQYTTMASVADLEAIRRALGYRALNLAGGSYGTRLALEYVRAHEAHVRTVVLEGPVPTTQQVPQGFGASAQRALDAVLDECLADRPCARAFPGVRDEARTVFDRLREAPAVARLGDRMIEMTRDHVAEAVRYMLYSTDQASRVPLALHEAYAGDFTILARFLADWRASGTFDALYLAITCVEDVPFVAADAAERDEPTFLGGYRVRQQRAACAAWPQAAAPSWRNQPVRSQVPVLILSGTLDPVTPSAFGDEIARTLPNSLHLRIPSGAHGWRGLTGVDCIESLKADFVTRGSVAGLDWSCTARIRRSGFVVARGTGEH
jgi:pimeloyl-ACP methyl ester carboxylesterase